MNDTYRRRAAAAVIATSLAGAGTVFAADTKFNFEDGFRLRSEDRQWVLNLGGRVHLDAASYDDDVTPLDNGAVWRRVRPRLDLEYGDRWSLRADYDFGNFSDGWKNAWVQYRFAESWDIRVGSQVVPFGIEETMSSDDVMFMERPLATLLAPGILTGVLVRGNSRSMSYSFGYFENDLSDDDRRTIDGRSVTGRITAAPIRSGRNILHFGLSAEYRNAKSGENARFRSRPESSVTDRRLVDTRTIDDVDDLFTFGTEFAWAHGPGLLQAEYLASEVTRTVGDTVDLDGWYVSGSYLLTGEARRYIRHIGSFGDVRPRRRWGAVELALRYGELDLQDGDITGGQQANVAIGVNWYWNRNCRLMLNHLWIDADPNRDGVPESPSAWQARLQVGF